MIEHPVTVPNTLDQALSPEWLTAALRTQFPGVAVRTVVPGPVVTRITTNARFTIHCGDAHPEGLYPHLCVKGYFSEAGRAARFVGEPEASFYRDLADVVKVRTLRSVWAGVEPHSRHGVVITEDVLAQGGMFLDGNKAFTPEQAAEILAELARLHAATWTHGRYASAAWLAPRLAKAVEVWGEAKTLAIMRANHEGENGRGIPMQLRDPERLLAQYRAVAAWLSSQMSSGWCVIHGDTHAGNTFLDGVGRPSLLDWQLVQRGMWYLDVGYHIASALTVEDRRRAESDLLRHYLHALGSHGVEPPSFQHAQTAICYGMIHGFYLWSITSLVQPAIIATLLHRLGTAVADHDAFSLARS